MINAPNAIRKDLAGAPFLSGSWPHILIQILTTGLFGPFLPNGYLVTSCHIRAVQTRMGVLGQAQIFGTRSQVVMHGF
jgi:hypothetical protein